jgi:CheY-like chemotaxis protein
MSMASTLRARVLIVEPQFVLRRTMAALMRKLDLAEVVEATSIEAAAALLKQKTFECMVIDMAQSAQALDLIRALREGELGPQTNTLVCATADASFEPALQAELMQAGVTLRLKKPFKMEQLLTALGLHKSTQ